MSDKKKLPPAGARSKRSRYPAECACGHDFGGEDPPPRRECSKDDCGHEWIPTDPDGDDKRNCPECNNPFSRRIEDAVCPECEEVVDELDNDDEDDDDEEEEDAMPAKKTTPTTPDAERPMPTISVHELATYEHHPAAAWMPKFTADETATLGRSIGALGVLMPIVLTHTRQLFDGRHRIEQALALAKKSGQDIALPVVIMGADINPMAYMHALNVARRHLKADQVVAYYERLKTASPDVARTIVDEAALRAEAKVAQTAGLNEGVSRGDQVVPTGRTAEKVAAALTEQFGVPVNAGDVKRVKRVAKEAPAKLADVERGTVTARRAVEPGATPATKRPTPAGVAKLGPDASITRLRQIRGQLPDRLIEPCKTFEAMLRKEHYSFREVFIEYLPGLLACVRSNWLGR